MIRLHEGRPRDAARAFERLPEQSRYRGLIDSCDQATLESLAGPAQFEMDPEFFYESALMLVTCGRPEASLALLRRAINQGYCAISALESEQPFRPRRSR